MKKAISKVFSVGVLLCSTASVVLAQTDYGLGDLNPVIDRIKTILQAIGFVAAVLCVIFGGFQIITAGGSVDKVETGRKWIMYAIVGLVVILIGEALARIACYIGKGSWTC